MDSKEKLFSEFPPVETSQWIQKIEKDLKTIPFGNLTWKTIEGLNFQPFYREENLKDTYAGSFPANPDPDWEIRQDIKVTDPVKDNLHAIDSLNRGATALRFIFSDDVKPDKKSFRKLLDNIHFDCIGIHFLAGKNSSYLMKLFAEEVRWRGIDPLKINGTINIDPIGTYSRSGNAADIKAREFKIIARLMDQHQAAFPGMRIIGINADIFHNTGASIVQDLGLSLAVMSEYLSVLTELGIPAGRVLKSMHLNFSSGPVYFMEIARVRAARILFSKMAEAWEVDPSPLAYIHCTTSEFTQTVYDPYVNMLRSTTQGMSASIGGADSITIVPYDNAFREPSEFSERIARNTNIILKEEAFLNRVSDPSAGSYYIENITSSLVKSAWNLLINIENEGGYTRSFKAGNIRKLIEETNSARQKNISTRRDSILGVNKYPDPSPAPEDLDITRAFPKLESKDIPILGKSRLAMQLEEIRINNEREEPKKKVFLLTYGSKTWRRARAGFSADFFGCAGYEIIDNPGFESIEQGISKAIEIKPHIVVLCSSDAEYPLISRENLSELKAFSVVVLAGYPQEILEDLKSKGIENFIHVKSNLPEEVKKIGSLIGSIS